MKTKETEATETTKTQKKKTDNKQNPDRDKPMPLLSHLDELRKRIIVIAIYFGISFIVLIPFASKILDIFLKPFTKYVNRFIFTKPFEAFFAYLQTAIFGALFLSVPIIIWEIWLFVSPALYPNERRFAKIFVISVSFLFISGGLFGYFLVLPRAFSFLISNFSSESITPFISISEFLGFAIRFLLGFGLGFQTPIIVFLSAKLGLVKKETLLSSRKYVIVLLLIVAAILTPTPDAITQIALAIPLLVLWEIGILLVRLFA